MKPLLIAFLVIACGTGGIFGLAWMARTRPTQEQGTAALRDSRPVRVAPNVVAAVEASISASRRPSQAGISNAELQSIIAEVYGVETSRFIQPNILWITAPTSPDLQRTCEGIANLWAARSGLNYVCVESWQGNTRLARATVQNGQFIE
jgi:hypothetical protein